MNNDTYICNVCHKIYKPFGNCPICMSSDVMKLSIVELSEEEQLFLYEEREKLYEHKKTKKLYYVIDEYIINTTNDDREIMVLYKRDGKTFIMEKEEFFSKFCRYDTVVGKDENNKDFIKERN